MPALKPARWVPSQGLVAPQYRHFWNNLRHAVDLNGTDYDIVHGAAPEFRAGEWKTTQSGVGWEVTAATTDKLHWPMHPDHYFVGDTAISVFVTVQVTASAPGSGVIYGLRGSADNGCWLFYTNSSSGLVFSHKDGAGTWQIWDTSDHTFPSDSKIHTMGFVREVGGQGIYYLNGVPDPQNILSSTPAAPVSDIPMSLGGVQVASTSNIGGVYLGAYTWIGRALTDAEMLILARDPFAPLRPAGDAAVALAYTAVTLTPDATGTVTAMWNELAQTTNLHLSIDEWPETATDFITSGEGDGSAFIGMTATPANFGSMKTLTIEGYARNSDFGADTCNLYAQVFKSDESTALTDEVLLGNQTLDGLVEIDFTLNAAGLAATKGEWDGCVVKIREDYTA